MTVDQVLESLGLDPAALKTGDRPVRSPIDGRVFAHVADDTAETLDTKIAR
ncbi:MAG: aldehyde dehydrogenase family protein, partial [Alphaproteobacteria bacterium]